MATINYIGNVDLLYILTKIKNVLDNGWVEQEAGKGLSTNDFTTALLNKLNGIADSADAVSASAVLSSGTKVATITINGTDVDIYVPAASVPDSAMSSTSTNAVQNKVIKQYVDDAIGGVTQIRFELVNTLPATGETGVIYLVPNGGSGSNVKDEYIWLESSSTFEKIGTTDVDLSGYVQTTDLVEVSTSDIDSMFSNVFGS